MQFEIDLIKWLQSGDKPLIDHVVYFITQFGSEIFFILAVMILYWCVDKREGFRLVNLFMLSQVTVGIIKAAVGRVRPYYHEGIKPILEQTEGYSFPSGHSSNIAVIGTDLTLIAKNKGRFFKTTLIMSVIIVPLVMFSRVYLGQHFPTDTIVGAIIGVGTGLIGWKLFDLLKDKEERLFYAIAPLSVVCLVVALVYFAVRGQQLDSLATVAGTYLAAGLGYWIEKRYVGYEVRADKAWKYIVRVLIGAVIVLALKEGLKAVFGLFASGILEIIMRFVRYFTMGIFVTLLAPMMFKKLKI
ncbi:MAG: phosphatase PAP2 family protein [Clostridia bacterium]|nr:phosphatase PAP2 family protein [Clostridia bacterium]